MLNSNKYFRKNKSELFFLPSMWVKESKFNYLILQKMMQIENNTEQQFHITFETIQYYEKTKLNIPFTKLQKWSIRSEFLETLLKSNTENENLVVDVSHVVNLETLLIIFKFLESGFVYKVEENQRQNLITGLGYFGVCQEDLNLIRKCFGFVYTITEEDKKIHNDETALRSTLNLSTSKECQEIDKLYICELFPNEKQLWGYPRAPVNWFQGKRCVMDKQTKIAIHSPREVLEIFNTETKNVFKDFPNCVVAGGKLFGYVCNRYREDQYKLSDFDIFVLADNQTEVLTTIEKFYQKISQIFSDISVLKTKYTITFYNSLVEFQIIRKWYKSVTDVLTDFDIDCCCIAVCNNQLYSLPRFQRSLLFGGNLVNPNKDTKFYVQRLVKYFYRGMHIFVPGLNAQDPNFNYKCDFVSKIKDIESTKPQYFSSDSKTDYYFDVVKLYFRHHSRIVSEMYAARYSGNSVFDYNTHFIQNVSEFVYSIIQCNTVFCHPNIFEKTDSAPTKLFDDMYISPLVR